MFVSTFSLWSSTTSAILVAFWCFLFRLGCPPLLLETAVTHTRDVATYWPLRRLFCRYLKTEGFFKPHVNTICKKYIKHINVQLQVFRQISTILEYYQVRRHKTLNIPDKNRNGAMYLDIEH